MADPDGNGGGGDVIDRPEDRGGPMVAETEDQIHKEAVAGAGAVVEGGGDGGEGREQEVDRLENPCVTEENPRATVLTGAVGSILIAEGSGAVVEDSPIVGGSSGGVGGSGAAGGDPGLNGTPPRDLARGKGIAVSEELVEKKQTTETALLRSVRRTSRSGLR
ncbi:hypothetical protein RHMOL_Rhmol04G0166800 [Rhododendron molle]|uniref:Uncharacterized protein n=1 Tax=Rhododendron molle TaxID=49168 RepID=A0ACC0P157_RHOML|nr:hypothetical protein RHMOL_Rhmol04G0166800 [Rhododendron molle]